MVRVSKGKGGEGVDWALFIVALVITWLKKVAKMMLWFLYRWRVE